MKATSSSIMCGWQTAPISPGLLDIKSQPSNRLLKPPVDSLFQGLILWMNEIRSHDVEFMRNHCLLVFTLRNQHSYRFLVRCLRDFATIHSSSGCFNHIQQPSVEVCQRISANPHLKARSGRVGNLARGIESDLHQMHSPTGVSEQEEVHS